MPGRSRPEEAGRTLQSFDRSHVAEHDPGPGEGERDDGNRADDRADEPDPRVAVERAQERHRDHECHDRRGDSHQDPRTREAPEDLPGADDGLAEQERAIRREAAQQLIDMAAAREFPFDR